jgi:hypothetical protein
MPDDLEPAAHYFWWITDERTQKRRKTAYRLQPADALERHPDATPDLASRELRSHIGNAADIGGTSAPSAGASSPSSCSPPDRRPPRIFTARQGYLVAARSQGRK